MVAYNFAAEFVPAVQMGGEALHPRKPWTPKAKTQTIRAPRKSAHAYPGDRVQLYTGMMHPNCTKLVSPDPWCLYQMDVTFKVGLESFDILIPGLEAFDATMFARADGFKSTGHMAEWFRGSVGPGLHRMTLVGWGSPGEWRIWRELYGGAHLEASDARHTYWLAAGVLLARKDGRLYPNPYLTQRAGAVS